MKKVIILIALMFLLPNWSFAQNMDEQIFQSICMNLIHQDSFNTIAQKLKNKVVLVADPVSGYQWIKYIDTSDSKTTTVFDSYSKNDRINILSGQSFPYLPLADTIYIVDTNGFLNNEYSFESGGHFFKIALHNYDLYGIGDGNKMKYKKIYKQFIDNTNTRHLFLHRVRMYQNLLTLSFVFIRQLDGEYKFPFKLKSCELIPGKPGYSDGLFYFLE